MTARSQILILILLFLFSVAASAAYYLLYTVPGLTFCAAFFVSSQPAGAVTVSAVEGSLARGAVFRDVEISDIKNFPGAVIRMQELSVVLQYPRKTRVRVKNGRVELPSGEVISFAGTFDSGKLSFNVYSGQVYAKTLFHSAGISGGIDARLSNLDLLLTNTPDSIFVSGTCEAQEAVFTHFSARNFPLSVSLIVHTGRGVKVYGRVTATGGTLVSPNATMNVREGTFDFSGDPGNPRFRVRGATKISDTGIDAVFSGTPGNPQIHLSSQPPLPEDRLMVMLLTGKSWEGTESAMTQGRITPGLIQDFADFFVFGGSVENLERKLGITDFALTYQKGEKGFEVHKSITPSTGFIYGVSSNRGDLNEGNKQQTQTVGLEYKLNEAISVEGRQQLREKPVGLQDKPANERAIRLKFKKSF
jgi:hypothetical protein